MGATHNAIYYIILHTVLPHAVRADIQESNL